MIFVCFKPSSGWNHFEVAELDTEKAALEFISEKNIPQTRLAGVFKGERLLPQVGEKKVVRKGVVGFSKYEEEAEE